MPQKGKLLPIEPKWNWNYNAINFSNDFNRLPIEPKWNWNVEAISSTEPSLTLPIEPKWNWNQHSWNQDKIPCLLPIEPKWNWNVKLEPSCKTAAFSSNRTKVELKRSKIYCKWKFSVFQSNQSGIETRWSGLQTLQVAQLPIEPKWNWNALTLRFYPCKCPSNRTKVELKHVKTHVE